MTISILSLSSAQTSGFTKSTFHNLSIYQFFFLKNPSLAQFIPRIYNKIYYKNSMVFLGRYIGFDLGLVWFCMRFGGIAIRFMEELIDKRIGYFLNIRRQRGTIWVLRSF